MELTDAMRRAVAAEGCERLGHEYSAITAIIGTGEQRPDGLGPIMTLNTRDNMTPHLQCTRCFRVWLVVETGGADYHEAEDDLLDRLLENDELRTRLLERRALRNSPTSLDSEHGSHD